MTQQNLDHSDIDTILKQVRGKAVPQGMIPTIVWPDSRGTHRFKNVIHRMQTIL